MNSIINKYNYNSNYTILSNTTNLYPIIDNTKCVMYNNDSGQFIKEFDGIPENLVINLIVWTVLLILFTFIRRIEDYGRFGLLHRNSGHEEETLNKIHFTNKSSSWSSIFTTQTSIDENLERQQISEYPDRHFLSWLVNIFKLKDKHILEKCGKDALNYIVFQRYIISYLAFVTIISISIILPINYSGNIISDKKVFGSTTIVNVIPTSSVLWVHLVASWLFLIVCFIIMRIFSKRMHYAEAEYVSRTVMILNIPIDKCDYDLFKKHINESHNELIVNDIQFAYDIKELFNIEHGKHRMQAGKISSEKILQETGQRPKMYPYHCGSLFEVCCCCCTKAFYTTDAIDYYTDREKFFRNKFSEAKEIAYNNPLGIAFVTFKDERMAANFLKYYHNIRSKCCCCCFKNSSSFNHISSSVSDELNAEDWSVCYAPSPSNIKWENLTNDNSTWWMRWIFINVIILVVLLFFTTPAMLIDILSNWSHSIHIDDLYTKLLPRYLSEFLPSLVLRLFSALMPVVVGYTALIEKYWTRSGENRSIMIKTFVLLIFMVLILPTVGLTSVNALFMFWSDKTDEDKNFKWKCVAVNGAFFVKYITTCSLIGTALDLLRLPELSLYLLRIIWSRSMAERLAVKLKAACEFDYGTNYAWILTLFTVTICFSVVCPLITPFGLVYLLLKHFVDRYNIYFAYIYTKVDKNIHKNAVSFTIASVIMLQFSILFFIVVKNGNKDSMTIVQIIVICLSCLLFFGHMFFGWFKKLSLFSTKNIHDEAKEIAQNSTNTENEENIEEIRRNEINATGNLDIELQSPFVPGFLRSFSPTESMKPLAGSTYHFDEVDANRRDDHFSGSTSAISANYGSLKLDNNKSDVEVEQNLNQKEDI